MTAWISLSRPPDVAVDGRWIQAGMGACLGRARRERRGRSRARVLGDASAAHRLGHRLFAERFIEGGCIASSTVRNGVSLLSGRDLFLGLLEDRPRIVDYRAKWVEYSFEYIHTPRSFTFSADDESSLGWPNSMDGPKGVDRVRIVGLCARRFPVSMIVATTVDSRDQHPTRALRLMPALLRLWRGRGSTSRGRLGASWVVRSRHIVCLSCDSVKICSEGEGRGLFAWSWHTMRRAEDPARCPRVIPRVCWSFVRRLRGVCVEGDVFFDARSACVSWVLRRPMSRAFCRRDARARSRARGCRCGERRGARDRCLCSSRRGR